MANKPLPKIACKAHGCWKVQEYRGQKNCIYCDKELNRFHVASQIAIQGQAQHTAAQN